MIFKKKLSAALLGICFFLLLFPTSCEVESKGFVLPDGDKESGKATFLKFQCNNCHSVGDIEWVGNDDKLYVELGGGVTFKKTYGSLVTAIIHPSHRIIKQYPGHDTAQPKGKSKMPNFNEAMTVQELVDIVSFLEGEYQIEKPYLDL